MTMSLPDLSVATVHLLARGRIERIWGPPGTGKTTTLAGRLRSTVAGRGPDAAVVVSFTHTAAAAIAARDTGLPDTAVGTLHSLAYRAIGGPATASVALDQRSIRAWNQRVGPGWHLSEDARRAVVELSTTPTGGKNGGDALIGLYDVHRARLQPTVEWPPEVRRFGQAWEEYKATTQSLDFTDMMLQALARALEGEPAPGSPQVLVGDEAQDFTPLETALMLAWGRQCDRLVLALDDDQSINQWRGGDPAPILALGLGMDGEPQPGVEVIDTPLEQSHRVPSAVQAAALHWIGQIPPERRRAKTYRPRAEGGKIYHPGFTLFDAETARSIMRDTQAGRRVMVLATCQYMLQPVLKNLRELGVPFWNPYRPAEAAWNPLRVQEGRTSTAERLYRYLVLDERAPGMADRWRDWTGDDVRGWVDLLGTKEAGLLRGAKKASTLLPDGTVDYAQIAGLFADQSEEPGTPLARCAEPDLDWFCAATLSSKRDKLVYPAAIARRFGPAALLEPDDWEAPPSEHQPQVIAGTIHSVKGGQADVVYLSPSISGAAYGQWVQGGAARDEIHRTFYVGLTRAKQSVVILGSTERHVPRELLCPPELVRR